MNKKINFTDLTFLIPFRQDSLERLENIVLVTEFLIGNFKTNIKVLECAPYNNGLLEKLLDKTIQYDFLEDNDPILFRTKYINQMVREAETPYVSIWDIDAIAPVHQIVKALELLRLGEADFVYPYEKQFLDTSPIFRKLYIQERKIELLEQNTKKMKEMYPPNPVGGGFLASLKTYKEVGIENENFYGWGLEDGERYYRWKNLGYKIKRVPGPMFHITHMRGLNSDFHNADQVYLKRKEITRVMRNKCVAFSQPNIEQITLNSLYANE